VVNYDGTGHPLLLAAFAISPHLVQKQGHINLRGSDGIGMPFLFIIFRNILPNSNDRRSYINLKAGQTDEQQTAV